jgi:hypothetical protein
MSPRQPSMVFGPVDVTAAVVQPPLDPGPLPGSEVAVRLHSGLRRLNMALLPLRMVVFSVGEPPGFHSLIEAPLLARFPGVDAGAIAALGQRRQRPRAREPATRAVIIPLVIGALILPPLTIGCI